MPSGVSEVNRPSVKGWVLVTVANTSAQARPHRKVTDRGACKCQGSCQSLASPEGRCPFPCPSPPLPTGCGFRWCRDGLPGACSQAPHWPQLQSAPRGYEFQPDLSSWCLFSQRSLSTVSRDRKMTYKSIASPFFPHDWNVLPKVKGFLRWVWSRCCESVYFSACPGVELFCGMNIVWLWIKPK